MNPAAGAPTETMPESPRRAFALPVDPDAFAFLLPVAVAGVIGWLWAWPWLWVLCLALAAAILAFFRDPARRIPSRPGGIVSPASGRVDEISENTDPERGPAPGKQISIFLSVLDCHINRAPCEAVVEKIRHEKGLFLNALNPESGRRNECNRIFLRAGDRRITVRQVAGLIARRIVCRVAEGRKLARGERIGLIRFGSRTDLILPAEAEILVKRGDKVTGGATLVAVLPEKT